MMRKIIKRAVAAFMVSALAITGAYGLMTAAAEETEEEPMPRNTIDEFLLSTWKAYYNFDIDSYDEQTKGLAEAGMNFIWHPGCLGVWRLARRLPFHGRDVCEIRHEISLHRQRSVQLRCGAYEGP